MSFHNNEEISYKYSCTRAKEAVKAASNSQNSTMSSYLGYGQVASVSGSVYTLSKYTAVNGVPVIGSTANVSFTVTGPPIIGITLNSGLPTSITTMTALSPAPNPGNFIVFFAAQQSGTACPQMMERKLLMCI
jgi:hypothetical protein